MLSSLLAAHRERAVAVLPEIVESYFAGGSGEELTLAESGAAWRGYRLRPRALRDVSRVETGVSLLGCRLASPVALAPSAYHRLAHPDGEVATAAGAAAAGGLLVVSSRCSVRLESVARAVADGGGSWWFQAYVMRDRSITAGLVRRAAAAGARAVVLTGDSPVVGSKLRQGTDRLPLSAEIAGVNVDGPPREPAELDAALAQDPATTLADIGWLAELSGLPVLVKGVLRADDAADCVAAGAAGIVVSTHGGRQLDRSVASAHALPAVAAAVGDRVPVLVDGGISSATDVLVALALGARAVLVGRPVLWALAAGGAPGVTALLDGFRTDLIEALQLAGVRSPAEVGADLLARPGTADPLIP